MVTLLIIILCTNIILLAAVTVSIIISTRSNKSKLDSLKPPVISQKAKHRTKGGVSYMFQESEDQKNLDRLKERVSE